MPREAEAGPRVEHERGRAGVPVSAHATPGRPRPYDRGPYAGALQLQLQRVDQALQPPLARRVRRHERPGADDHVGGDEHDGAAPALDHPRHERPDHPVGADEVEIDLAGEPLGTDLDGGARSHPAGIADDDLGLAEVGGHLVGEAGHRGVVGDIQPMRDRLTALGADAGGEFLEHVDAPRAEGDRVARGREDLRGLRADAGRRPGDHRRAAVGVAVLLSHGQALGRVKVVGRFANPRTLVEWTRTARSACTWKSSTRRTSSPSTTRASSRARLAPRQKWRPVPKLRIFPNSALSRWMSNRAGAVNTRSSRLADPSSTISLAPAGPVLPWSSTSVAT